MFVKGDLVIKRHSKAKKLKSKIFKILAEVTPKWQYYREYQAISPHGKQIRIRSEYTYIKLIDDVANKERAVSRAQRNLSDAIAIHLAAEEEAKTAYKYFPTV